MSLRRFLFPVLACASLVVTAVPAQAAPWWPAPPKPAAPVCSGPTVLKSDGTPWTCTFDDEFSGTRLDTTKWVPITTASSGLVAGGSTGALGCFLDSPGNVSVGNGVLSLTARKESAPFTCNAPSGKYVTQYSAGQVGTYGRFTQTYGRFSISARFPAATVAGLQSALWMWPQNPTATGLSGEIDIAEEYSGLADRAIPTLHYALDQSTVNPSTDTNVVTNNYCLITNVNAFHQYTLVWTPTTMTVSYDGSTCLVDNLLTSGASPFSQPFFLVLTQSLGIAPNAFDPASTPLPATTQIDWVRAWK